MTGKKKKKTGIGTSAKHGTFFCFSLTQAKRSIGIDPENAEFLES